MKNFKRRNAILLQNFDAVVEEENNNGWELVDFEKGKIYRSRDLVFRRGDPTFQTVVGNAFYMSSKVTIASGTNEWIHIKTGSKYVFVKSVIITPSSEEITATFEEVTGITDGSTTRPVYNRQRNADNGETVTIYTNSTNPTGITVLEESYMPGETGVGEQRRGDRLASDISWVLEPNSDYLRRLTNDGGSEADVSIEATWFEMSE